MDDIQKLIDDWDLARRSYGSINNAGYTNGIFERADKIITALQEQIEVRKRPTYVVHDDGTIDCIDHKKMQSRIAKLEKVIEKKDECLDFYGSQQATEHCDDEIKQEYVDGHGFAEFGDFARRARAINVDNVE